MRLLKSTTSKLLRFSEVVKAAFRLNLLTEAMAHSSIGTAVSLETLAFVNRALKSLPVEENTENYVRTVPGSNIMDAMMPDQWLLIL